MYYYIEILYTHFYFFHFYYKSISKSLINYNYQQQVRKSVKWNVEPPLIQEVIFFQQEIVAGYKKCVKIIINTYIFKICEASLLIFSFIKDIIFIQEMFFQIYSLL